MAKILTVIPYTFYPPVNGGSSRCFYILREMAREHEVYLLTVQPKEDFQKAIDPEFPGNVTVISLHNAKLFHSAFNTLPTRVANAVNFRVLRKTLIGSTNSYFLQTYPHLVKAIKEIMPDIVYYENLESVALFSSTVRQYLPDANQIYDAHNVDSELWLQRAKAEKNSGLKVYAANALKIEKQLSKKVSVVFCCSNEDQEKISQLNKGKIAPVIIPNGVDTEEKPYDANPQKFLLNEILFCGSLDYFPNKEGLLWFYEDVFPLVKKTMPALKLTIIGKGKSLAGFDELREDSSVNFVGEVASVIPYYKQSAVAIAPLKSGSGTRLKILEAMSLGNPVVSTLPGAEGIRYTQNENISLANDPVKFADNITDLLQNQYLFNQQRENARMLVEHSYGWNKIGIKINSLLGEMAAAK